MAQPTALIIAGILMGVLAVMPGAPHLQLAIIAAALIGLGMQVRNKSATAELSVELPAEEGPIDENAHFKDINNIYPLLNIEPIEMEFGYSLIPLVDEESGGKLINRIVIFRRQYAQDMGFVVPSIRLRDSSALNTNQYIINIKGEEIARGEILTDYYLALEPSTPVTPIDGIETIEPAYGIPGKWITADKKEMAEIYGYTVIDPLSVMVTHLSETVKKHAHELLTRSEVMQLIDNTKQLQPQLVEEVFPDIISYANFQKILSNLLKEGVPIKDMVSILECIIDNGSSIADLDTITEKIRIALKRTITRRFCENGQMRVVTLDAELEKTIVGSLARSDQGVYLALSPDTLQSIITQLSEQLKKFAELSQRPIILTSHVVRVYFARLIEQFYPNVYVLSFNEIANNVQIQAIGNIEG